MNVRTLMIAMGLFAVGGLAGWSLASAPDNGGDAPASDSPETAKSSRSMSKSSRSAGRVPEEARMRAIRDSKNEGDRMSAAIALANSLPLDQAGRWLDEGLFSQRKGYALTLFTKILEKRWQTEDPDGYLVWQLGNGKDVSQEEMVRLSESNPGLLLASIRLIEDPQARGRALGNLAKASLDLALAELAKMNTADLKNTGSLQSIFSEMARTDLAGLQAVVEGLPFHLQEEAQKAIYGQLLAKDFSSTLSQLIDLPNGLDILMAGSDVLSKNRQGLLESFASLPKAWQKQLEGRTYYFTNGLKSAEILSTYWQSYGLSETAGGRLKGYALFSESRRDKEGALELFQNTDLGETGRRHFLDMLNWNGGQDTINDLLPHLEKSDQDYITKEMEGSQGTSNPRPEMKTAADLSEVLAKVDSNSYSNYSSVMQNWNADQKAQFQDDYAAMRGEERHRVTAALSRAQDLEVRTAAVDELLENPEAREVAGWQDSQATTAASQLAVDLLKHDADRATTWVGNLPEGETRSWAMKNLARNWKNYDPAAAESWVDSLPPTERQDVRSFLENPGP